MAVHMRLEGVLGRAGGNKHGDKSATKLVGDPATSTTDDFCVIWKRHTSPNDFLNLLCTHTHTHIHTHTHLTVVKNTKDKQILMVSRKKKSQVTYKRIIIINRLKVDFTIAVKKSRRELNNIFKVS